MAKKTKKTTRLDLVTEDMFLAEEDLADIRPALAAAPELVLQTITPKRRRGRAKPLKKKAKKARKSSAKKTRKALPKRNKAKKTQRK